ncbi:class I SAM-dependent methyltransferase [Roseospira navarrensis]|uniref:Class I SAM-dependent methyltransferase n=1 Tax=Roseospira navarrensis TaxID=140058 RepID=A0A7X1ZEK5_9PROT|nr:class I SAM-dependent methyltransferase [Roseospira navarrensis]MQX37130.1 hypothetical protein [Roseospira navarrensis]
MLFLDITREQLLPLMPKGGRCAEIGVASGAFSQKIRESVAPSRLHLIDPWVHQADTAYAADENNLAQAEQDARFRNVTAMFAPQVADGSVVIHRAFSADAARDIPDGSLTFVYIDGDHTTDVVRADLETYSRKIEDAGFILGHDYANHPGARAQNMGVIEAVNAFVMDTDFDFVFLTRETWPTYVLARPGNAHLASVMGALLMMSVKMTEVTGFPHTTRFSQSIVRLGDTVRVLPRFEPVAR